MVDGGSLDVEGLLKIQVQLAILLTLGLLGIISARREKLLSDSAIKGIDRNMRVFLAAMLMFFLPLVLIAVTEIIEGISAVRNIDMESFEETLELAVISLLNVGLLLSYYITVRLMREK